MSSGGWWSGCVQEGFSPCRWNCWLLRLTPAALDGDTAALALAKALVPGNGVV
jgi:hypothetical protein